MDWPQSELGCLSEDNKRVVCSPVKCFVNYDISGEDVININKYSKFSKLINVTGFVFNFFYNLKHSDLNPARMAFVYLVKLVQVQHFKIVYDFFHNSESDMAPQLLKDFENCIKIDDIVLIKNNIQTRPFWHLGRVVRLIVGSDDKIRSAEIKIGDNIVLHSLKHLYPLELSLQPDNSGQLVEEPIPSCSQPVDSNNTRPKRTCINKSKNRQNDPYIWY